MLDENGMIRQVPDSSSKTKPTASTSSKQGDGSLGDGKYEFKDGYIVESDKAKREREEKNKKTPRPKLLLAGYDEPVDLDSKLEEKRQEEEAEKARQAELKENLARIRAARVFMTKDGFFIREKYPGYEKEYRQKEREREKEEKRKQKEEERKRKEEEKKRREEEKKKKKQEEEDRRRRRKQDEKNKKNGTYAGDGFHYEMREFKMVDGSSYSVKTRVPNESPEIKFL